MVVEEMLDAPNQEVSIDDLELEGSIVVADALHTNQETAQLIVKKSCVCPHGASHLLVSSTTDKTK